VLTSHPAGRRLLLEGVVQGVGFRPHAWRLAREHDLRGWVRNIDGAVEIVVEGGEEAVGRFCRDLVERAPPLARIDRVETSGRAATGATTFEVDASMGTEAGGSRRRLVAPDAATCPDCLHELRDPADRRHRYPFVNCTNCGPRFTIIDDLPYDRSRTSMQEFALCEACSAEYGDPGDRRFHAEPVACSACGPRLRLVTTDGAGIEGDPIMSAVALLRSGGIVAVKGLGGYQLACDATDETAVAELRRRKHRPHKPFAVMVADLAAARQVAAGLGSQERALLTSPAAPIVLVRARRPAGLAPSIAPGHEHVGVLFPTTPLHHLLLGELGRPLVMTSGNRSDEPIAIDDSDALRRLGDIADAFVAHDRGIACRYDDSVAAIRLGAPALLRRARGYSPAPLRLPVDVAPTLAVGAELASAFCLAAGRDGFVSPHIGDLDTDDAVTAFMESLDHHRRLLRIEPEVVAHDLHPDFASTRLAASLGLPRVAVQHHHAHVVSVMAEHGLRGPVLGIAFDGFGLGADGTSWGGELLLCDWSHAERVGHLRPVRQPGGDAAVRHPARMALAHALDAGRFRDALAALGLDHDQAAPSLAGAKPSQIAAQVDAGLHAAPTSSVGRLFDAVAALTGICVEATYEGHGPMLLEQAAIRADAVEADRVRYPVTFAEDPASPLVIDARPLVGAVLDDIGAGVGAPTVARRFHDWLASVVVDAGASLVVTHGVRDVCLAGGVFANGLLLDRIAVGFEGRGLRVHIPRSVPPGDGGLALGQVLVAHARHSAREG